VAIEYSLILDTSRTPADVAGWLQQACKLSLESDSPHPTLLAQGILCTILPQSKLGRELVRETFHIGSTTTLLFRLDKFEHLPAGMEQVVRITIAAIHGLDCDLVLLANGEKGVILKQGGQAFADVRDPYWRDKLGQAFAAADSAFTERELPVM
jgi:hypothetical protein